MKSRGQGPPDGTSAKVGVLAKTADIMDQLTATGEPLSMAELSRRLGIPRATLHRLVRALEELDILVSDDGCLRPGLRLLRWAGEAWSSSDLRRAARPVLERLVHEVGETAALFVRVGFARLCLDRVEGPGLLRSSTRVGEAHPLHVGASGKVLLAAAPPATWQDIWRSSRRRFADERGGPMPDLAAVRVQGFAIAAGDRDAALSSASVPVQAPGGEVVAALSISGPGSRLTTERIEGLIPLMRAAAAEIRSQIGGRAGGPTEGVSRGATGSHGHRCNTAY